MASFFIWRVGRVPPCAPAGLQPTPRRAADGPPRLRAFFGHRQAASFFFAAGFRQKTAHLGLRRQSGSGDGAFGRTMDW
jgi:hypothetical protein